MAYQVMGSPSSLFGTPSPTAVHPSDSPFSRELMAPAPESPCLSRKRRLDDNEESNSSRPSKRIANARRHSPSGGLTLPVPSHQVKHHQQPENNHLDADESFDIDEDTIQRWQEEFARLKSDNQLAMDTTGVTLPLSAHDHQLPVDNHLDVYEWSEIQEDTIDEDTIRRWEEEFSRLNSDNQLAVYTHGVAIPLTPGYKLPENDHLDVFEPTEIDEDTIEEWQEDTSYLNSPIQFAVYSPGATIPLTPHQPKPEPDHDIKDELDLIEPKPEANSDSEDELDLIQPKPESDSDTDDELDLIEPKPESDSESEDELVLIDPKPEADYDNKDEVNPSDLAIEDNYNAGNYNQQLAAKDKRIANLEAEVRALAQDQLNEPTAQEYILELYEQLNLLKDDVADRDAEITRLKQRDQSQEEVKAQLRRDKSGLREKLLVVRGEKRAIEHNHQGIVERKVREMTDGKIRGLEERLEEKERENARLVEELERWKKMALDKEEIIHERDEAFDQFVARYEASRAGDFWR